MFRLRRLRWWTIVFFAVISGLIFQVILWQPEPYDSGAMPHMADRFGRHRVARILHGKSEIYPANNSTNVGSIFFIPTRDGSQTIPDPELVCHNVAEPQTSDHGLLSPVLEKEVWLWISDRVRHMWPDFSHASRELWDQGRTRRFQQKQILVIPGVLLGTNFARESSIKNGGPLGELVQWADLIGGLAALGHNVTLEEDPEAATRRLSRMAEDRQTAPCETGYYDVIYTDITGYKQLPSDIQDTFKCRFRVLDVYGTEAMYNDVEYAQQYGYSSPHGGLGLRLKQFMTFYPQTPDNSFLGFVVVPKAASTKAKENIAVLYGKDMRYLRGQTRYISLLKKHMDVHHTMNGPVFMDGLVGDGVLTSEQYAQLLDRAKFFIGLGDPIEGTGVMEALATGCVFLNPRFRGRKQNEFINGKKPTHRKVTSQVPYLEQYVGPPHVYTVDTDEAGDIMFAVSKSSNSSFEPFIPYEFTAVGFLERLSIYLEKQRFCDKYEDDTWPSLDDLRMHLGPDSVSCVDTCSSLELVCEPQYLININKPSIFEENKVNCSVILSDEDVYYPSVTASKGRVHCILQGSESLFSCAGGEAGVRRLCPCRNHIKHQVALSPSDRM